jgi:hypothetical protein
MLLVGRHVVTSKLTVGTLDACCGAGDMFCAASQLMDPLSKLGPQAFHDVTTVSEQAVFFLSPFGSLVPTALRRPSA